MSRSTRIAAVAGLALVLTLGTAAPALAFGPPDITVTPSTTGENPLTAIAVVCPLTSETASIVWTGTYGGAPSSVGPDVHTLDINGEWTANYYFESFFDRDTDVTLTLTCLDATSTTTGTDSIVYHVPTTGAAYSTPATLAANADLVATGNCGTAASIFQIRVDVYDMAGPTQIGGTQTIAYTGPANYSVNLGTPTSLGLAAGSTVRVYVACDTNAPAVHATSLRFANTAVTAAAVPPPVTPAGPTGPTLAATGSESVLPLAAGAGLVALGAAVLLVRRRREAVVRGR